MTQDDGSYELTPKPETPPAAPDPVYQVDPPVSSASQSSAGQPSPKPGEPGWTPPVPVIEPADAIEEEDPDVQTHKGMAILAYIVFLIPLIAAPGSKFARYHANQGLLLFILFVVACVCVALLQLGKALSGMVLAKIPILDWFFSCGMSLLQPAILVGWVALMIVGIMHAANGETKPLPGVGHWTLIK